MIKNSLKKLGRDGTYLNIKKALYDKVTVNTIPNSEKLSAFPLRSGRRQHSRMGTDPKVHELDST